MDKDKNLGIFQQKHGVEITDLKVSAADYANNFMILGDERGHIHCYSINNQTGELFSCHSSFVSKTRIDQIKCIGEYNIAYILSNGQLFAYTISNLGLRFKFENKEVGSIHKISINNLNSSQVLIINKKKKVKCFSYNPEALKLEDMKVEELSVYELPEIIEWHGLWFCYANKKKVFFVNVNDGKTLVQEIETSFIKSVNNSWLLSTSGIGIFMELNVPKNVNPITFARPLVGLNVYKNYIIALHETAVTVYDSNDSSQVQEINIPSGSIGKYLIIGQNKLFYITVSYNDKKDKEVTAFNIYELKEVAYDIQILKLLNENKMEEALNIFNNNIPSSREEKPSQLEKFFLNSAWACIKKADFMKAYQYAKLTRFNPFEFMYLFTGLLNIPIIHEDQELKNSILPSIDSLINAFDRSSSSMSGIVTRDSLTNFKREDEKEKEAIEMLGSLLNEKRNFLINSYDIPKDNFRKIPFLNADNALISITNNDVILQKILEVISTVLIKVYVKLDMPTKKIWDVIDYDFFNCDWDELESFLYKENKDVSKITLAYLNEKRAKYEDALKTWQEYGNKVETDAAYSREACERTKVILKTATDKRLFHDYIQWMLSKFPVSAFDLFKQTEIVPVEYFYSTIIGAVDKVQSNLNLKEKFLEYYINSGSANERYHTILLENYIERLFKIKNFDSPLEYTTTDGNLKQYLDKFDRMLRNTNIYNKSHILEKIKGSWLIDQEIYLYSKLSMHEEALNKLVNIGVETNDFEKVETYAKNLIPEKPDILADFFKILSEGYNSYVANSKTTKSETEKKNLENIAAIYQKEILIILKKFGDNKTLDPFTVLQQIPSEWILSDRSLYEYLTKVMKNYTHMSNKYNIARNMSEMDAYIKEKEIAEVKDKAIYIGHETTCEFCRKKIGSGVFCVYPNMKVFHVKCASNPNVCPVTRIDFSKKKVV